MHSNMLLTRRPGCVWPQASKPASLSCAQLQRSARCQAVAAPPAEPQSAPKAKAQEGSREFADGWDLASGNGVHEDQAQQSPEKAVYNWEKQFYPVAVTSFLDPKRPHAVQLLGMHLVVWRDSANIWRCFEDRCPHRLAPLSEGRIEPKDGSLYCNYHGWRYNGDGSCAGIPQLDPSAASAIGNQRACAVSYPTREAEGLLWVWANAEKNAEAEADAAGYPGMCPEFDAGTATTVSGGWYFRDSQSHWLAGKENAFMDPSHDTVLHSGAIGSRDAARPLYVSNTDMGPKGFSVSYTRDPPAGSALEPANDPDQNAKQEAKKDQPMSAFTDSTAMPTGAMRRMTKENGESFIMYGYFVPLAANLTRHFVMFARSSDKIELPKPLVLVSKLPPWVGHIFNHRLLDADIAVQSGVDRNRRLDKGDKVFVPAGSDRGVVALHQWLRKFAGNTLPVPLEEPPHLSRREQLNRFSQHTEQCPSCLAAYKAAERVQKVAAAAGALLMVACVSSASIRGLAWATTIPGIGASLSCAIWFASSWLVKEFTFVDYSHEQHHTSKGS